MYAVLFDLDDTLYPELSYVRSGFRAVSQSMTADPVLQQQLLNQMLDLFRSDPRGVFDRLCDVYRGHLDCDVSNLVQIFRTHIPRIALYDDVIPTLDELRQHSLRIGIVTDGRADGQLAKIRSLGLSEHVDVVVVTDLLGPNRQFWKPHTRPFEVALSRLGVEPEWAVYVGDNSTKDFYGPLQLGMRTVRISRPDALNLFNQRSGSDTHWTEADDTIYDLKALLGVLREWGWLD